MRGDPGTMKAKVLLIDDEENLRKLMAKVIELEGYQVVQASCARDGLKQLDKDHFQVVITDVKLPDGNGVDLTLNIKKNFPSLEVIVLTAYGTIEDGVRAIKNGALDYLTKGDHQSKILPLLNRAAEKAILQQKVVDLESKITQRFGFENIIGGSEPLKQAVALARKVAATHSTVLLLGETGVGKEVFAQAIHYESPRKNKPIVALNCSAFTKELLATELFGHVEGAFTGAVSARKGLIEEANGGTLFLDEIGEMDPDLQVKLLRVLESKEYFRVGDSKVRKADVRIIAATNRELEKELDQGHFRSDLYYRLSVFVIKLPSLRDRAQDIEALATFFVRQFALKTNKAVPQMSIPFLQALRAHPWKGNIRELKNVIERCVILNDAPQLEAALLPADFNTEEGGTMDLASVEKAHIRKVLLLNQGNKTKAAKVLGIGLTTLYQKIKDYQL